VRVVKSQKDRTWDAILEKIVRIRNARKTNDWSVIQDEFEEVNKMIEKAKVIIAKNGIPKFYIKMLADVEDNLWTTLKDKDFMNNAKPVVARAINRMKLTIKKHNKNYEEQIADYRANPDKYEEEEEEEEEGSDEDSSDEDSDSSDSDSDSDSSDSSDDVKAKPKAKPKAAAKVSVSLPGDSLVLRVQRFYSG
jgi:translation initiation factor 3 subunit C